MTLFETRIMRILKTMTNDPDIIEEYDFSGGIRGKYSKRYEQGSNVVVIEPDVAEYFPDHESVNDGASQLDDNHQATEKT